MSGRHWLSLWCRHCGSVTRHRFRGRSLVCASCHPEAADVEPQLELDMKGGAR